MTDPWIIAGWMTLGLLVLVGLYFLSITATFLRFIVPIFEEIPLFGLQEAAPDPSAEPISCVTEDGLTLRGSLLKPLGSPRGLVLFFPELGGSHHFAPRFCEALIDAGFAVASMDVRNQGESDFQSDYKAGHWMTRRELDDAETIYRSVRERSDLRDLPIMAFGVSRGGGLALMIAARHPEVRAVLCESVFTIDTLMEHFARQWAKLYAPAWLLKITPDWHFRFTLRCSRWVSRLRTGKKYVIQERSYPKLRDRSVPALLISGKRDSYVKPNVPEEIQRCIGPTCDLWLVKKAKHNASRMADRETYDQRIVEFAESALTTPQPVGQSHP